MSKQDLDKTAENEHTDMSKTEAFEVADPNDKFMVIEGPQPVIVQFFRHYGHPGRDQNSLWAGDCVREIACIVLVCCLFLYFPVGLLIAQRSDEDAQYLWLGYQLYAILATHIIRALGWHDIGRTEKRIAKLLNLKPTIWLKSKSGCAVSASLVLYGVNKVADGEVKVQELIDQCKQAVSTSGADTGRRITDGGTAADGDTAAGGGRTGGERAGGAIEELSEEEQLSN
jgi:hypothetical protein